MPIYEYRCLDCRRKVSIFWQRLSAVDESKARCDACGSARLTRMVSKVRVLRHGLGDNGPKNDDADPIDENLLREMENVDENNPRQLGSLMRRMAEQTGESMGEEFDEVVGRLERGEDPEAIEAKMGDVLGGPDGMGGMDEMNDPYGMGSPPAPPTEDAAEAKGKPAKAERKAHKAVTAKPKRGKAAQRKKAGKL